MIKAIFYAIAIVFLSMVAWVLDKLGLDKSNFMHD
jgi:hypothetical protein